MISNLLRELVILQCTDNWSRYLSLFRNLDVYYSKEYVQLFAEIAGGEACAAFYKSGDTKIFYPFIKRKILLTDHPYYDIITPYGYGGVHVEGDPKLIEEFYPHFYEFCKKENIISEFVRFHPMVGNQLHAKELMKVEYNRLTTAVNLTKSYTEILIGYSNTNKRNIKTALKAGVQAFVDWELQFLDTFIEMYYETMNRNNAKGMYYFNQDYFYRQMKETSLSRSFLLLAKQGDEIVAGVILLIGKEYAHYHLGASRTEKLLLRPNNLLFDYMIKFSKEEGAKALHLGGGYEEDDNLFRFKSSFTNGNHFEFSVGKKIINPEAYDELTSIAFGGLPVNEKYFPLYRAI